MRDRRLAGALVFLVACGGSSSESVAPPSSTGAAPAADAAVDEPSASSAAGWDAVKLDELSAYAESNATSALLVVEGNATVFERYYAGADASYRRDVHSVQKSVIAVLAGIAIDKGLLQRNDAVSAILGAGWSNAAAAQESKITLEHLLSMSSGLDLNLGYAEPAGTAWLYNDDAFYRVRLCIEKVTGRSLDDVAHEWLFDEIGMTSSAFELRLTKDSMGIRIVGLKTTARDLVQFGTMLRARGSANGQTVVSSAFVDAATSTSQPMNPSYGFLFWLNGKDGGRLPPSVPFTGPLVPSAPSDAFAALGKGDQKVYVARSRDLVLVRLGESAGEGKNALSSFDEELWKRLIAAKK